MEELPLSLLPLLLAETLGRAGPAPWVGSTIEPMPRVDVWMSQVQSCEHGRVVPIARLPCGGLGGVEMLHPHLSTPEAGESWP